MMPSAVKKPLILSTLCLFLAGCASFPDEGERVNLDRISEDQVSDWERVPAVTHRAHASSLSLIEPGTLPARLYDIPLDLDLDGPMQVGDFADYLRAEGVTVAVASDDLARRTLPLPEYRGSIGGLLTLMTDMTGLSFRWSGDVLIVDEVGEYMIRVPQNEVLIEQIETTIAGVGAQDITGSRESGLLSYRATQSSQKVIETYLDQLSTNTSVINLQLAVVNVSLNEERNRGMNWSSIQGDFDIAGLLDSNAGGGESDSVGGPDVVGELTGTTFGVVAEGTNVSLSAVVNLLSNYGETQTTQNLTLKTLSGIPVSLRSGDTIPFVDDIDINTSASSDETTISGTSTDTVETGFTIEISPYYDSGLGLITVNLDVSLKSLTGFRELVSEGALGAIRQPETRDQELNSIVRLEAGETALIGGLVFESVDDSRSTLAGLERTRTASQNRSDDRNALFILMRPTVTVYGPDHRVPDEDEPAPESTPEATRVPTTSMSTETRSEDPAGAEPPQPDEAPSPSADEAPQPDHSEKDAVREVPPGEKSADEVVPPDEAPVGAPVPSVTSRADSDLADADLPDTHDDNGPSFHDPGDGRQRLEGWTTERVEGDQALIRDADGRTYRVRPGDYVDGLGYVQSIDADGHAVILEAK